MTLPFYLSPEAEAEMEAATLWYEHQLKGLGAEFLAAVDQVLARITDYPHSGSPVPRLADETIRRMPLRRFPYHIVYMEFPDRYQILALAHDWRRPFYWRDRVSS